MDRDGKDVIKKQCTKPKKKGIGPAKFFAAAVGTDGKSGERERREWLMWTRPNETWVAFITYHSSVLRNEGIVEKGEKFMKHMKEIKDKLK